MGAPGAAAPSAAAPGTGRAAEVFVAALRLGLTSFGGPVAHLGYFRNEYVERRRWLSDGDYAELVALGQLLPGPASSQVGMAVGYLRAGLPGAVASWAGFTLPSAVVMAAAGAVAAGSLGSGGLSGTVWVHALGLVAVAVVLDAVLGMAARLATSRTTAAIAVAAGVALLLLPSSAWAQVLVLAAGGTLGAVLLRARGPDSAGTGALAGVPLLQVPRRTGLVAATVLALLLAGLPLLRGAGELAVLLDTVLRAGALVFGGGHVVLPLLEAGTVPELVAGSDFLAGYGVAQAVPGPLFTFATYLGQLVGGPLGAVLATVAIFLPGFLVLLAVLPFWAAVRRSAQVQAVLQGVGAAVVGLLAAAFVDPVVTSSVGTLVDACYAALLFALLRLAGARPWQVVLVAVVASPVLGW